MGTSDEHVLSLEKTVERLQTALRRLRSCHRRDNRKHEAYVHRVIDDALHDSVSLAKRLA